MRFALLAAIVLSVTACGQKGSLYLRENPPPGVKPAKPEPYKPVPYPKDPGGEADSKK